MLGLIVSLLLGAVPPGPPVSGAAYGDGGVSAFYRWDGKPAPRAGLLLRREPVPAANMLADAAQGIRILYSSTSGWGAPRRIAVSGEVFLPRGTPPKAGWPVIAWAHGTVGTADVCAPSWAGRRPRDVEYLNAWLAQGYAVVTSDYEGLGTPGPHPYMGLQSAAYSMLDAVRAARRAIPGIGTATVMIGQSQGAHATFGAGLLARGYAPEVDLRAIVVTGLPGEIGFAQAGAPPTPIAPAALLDPESPRGVVREVPMDRFDAWGVIMLSYVIGWPQADPSLKVDDYLTPLGKRMVARLNGGCGAARMAELLADKPVNAAIYTRDPTPVEARLVRFRRYPDARLPVPMFVGIGLQDEQTSPEMSFNVVRAACARGSDVTVHFYPGLMHSPTLLASRADAVPFVKAVLAGKRPPGDCATLRWPGRR